MAARRLTGLLTRPRSRVAEEEGATRRLKAFAVLASLKVRITSQENLICKCVANARGAPDGRGNDYRSSQSRLDTQSTALSALPHLRWRTLLRHHVLLVLFLLLPFTSHFAVSSRASILAGDVLTRSSISLAHSSRAPASNNFILYCVITLSR